MSFNFVFSFTFRRGYIGRRWLFFGRRGHECWSRLYHCGVLASDEQQRLSSKGRCQAVCLLTLQQQENQQTTESIRARHCDSERTTIIVSPCSTALFVYSSVLPLLYYGLQLLEAVLILCGSALKLKSFLGPTPTCLFGVVVPILCCFDWSKMCRTGRTRVASCRTHRRHENTLLLCPNA